MPVIRPSSDLRNKYSDISNYCHEAQLPVFITKNGVGDLAVMSMEVYERLAGVQALRQEVTQGLTDVQAGKSRAAAEVFDELDREF